MVRNFTDRVMVMLEGKIVEHGPTEELFERSSHPYTQRLLAASPIPDHDVQRRCASRRQRLRRGTRAKTAATRQTFQLGLTPGIRISKPVSSQAISSTNWYGDSRMNSESNQLTLPSKYCESPAGS